MAHNGRAIALPPIRTALLGPPGAWPCCGRSFLRPRSVLRSRKRPRQLRTARGHLQSSRLILIPLSPRGGTLREAPCLFLATLAPAVRSEPAAFRSLRSLRARKHNTRLRSLRSLRPLQLRGHCPPVEHCAIWCSGSPASSVVPPSTPLALAFRSRKRPRQLQAVQGVLQAPRLVLDPPVASRSPRGSTAPCPASCLLRPSGRPARLYWLSGG